MNLEEYGTLLAAKHEMLSSQEFQDFLIEETMERMRVNVGLLNENTALKRRLETSRQEIQVQLLRVQAEVSDKAKNSEDMQRLTQANGYARAMSDAVKIVGRVLDQ